MMDICKTNNWLKLHPDEENEIYMANLKSIFENPREWLDNLDYIPVYRVSWKNYSKSNTPTLPKQYVKPKGL